MPSYRLLVFHGNRLSRSEILEAAGPIEAVEACVGRHIGSRVELWGPEGRIATIGSRTSHRREEPMQLSLDVRTKS